MKKNEKMKNDKLKTETFIDDESNGRVWKDRKNATSGSGAKMTPPFKAKAKKKRVLSKGYSA